MFHQSSWFRLTPDPPTLSAALRGSEALGTILKPRKRFPGCRRQCDVPRDMHTFSMFCISR